MPAGAGLLNVSECAIKQKVVHIRLLTQKTNSQGSVAANSACMNVFNHVLWIVSHKFHSVLMEAYKVLYRDGNR